VDSSCVSTAGHDMLSCFLVERVQWSHRVNPFMVITLTWFVSLLDVCVVACLSFLLFDLCVQ
jgi:hypothetical protein